MEHQPHYAHVVLQDVKHAIRNYDCSLQAEAFRISWFTVISLLRAVGHVLKNQDANTSPALAQAISDKWRQLQDSKPQPLIFWGFIEFERNRFLKEYVAGVTRTATIETLIPGVYATVDLANLRGGVVTSLPTPQSYLSSGPFEGQIEKDVAWRAYEWWQEYLRDVERLACQYAAGKHAPTSSSPLAKPPSGS
jgi:hypothetical protein